MRKREFYVLNYRFNEQDICKFNIFNSVKFTEGIDRLLKEFVTFDDFVEKLDSLLRYCFWCKREYEISVGDLFEQDLDKYFKVDVYSQVAPNIDVLAHLIIDCHNEKVAEEREGRELLEDYMLND